MHQTRGLSMLRCTRLVPKVELSPGAERAAAAAAFLLLTSHTAFSLSVFPFLLHVQHARGNEWKNPRFAMYLIGKDGGLFESRSEAVDP